MNPKARTDALIVQNMEDETLIYDRKSGKAHCLNGTAAIVWRHCDGTKSPREIAALLQKESEGASDEDVVWLAIEGLQRAKLLEGPSAKPANGALISRREVGRRLGLAGAAIALPTVLSLIAPTAAMAASAGLACTTASGCSAPNSCCCNGGSFNKTCQTFVVCGGSCRP